jgi:hypothetical protein
MAGTKAFVFNAQDLYSLLVHYTNGLCPLGGQVTSLGFNPYFTRMIGVEVESEEWETSEPLQLRYDGKKTMSWSKGMGLDPVWEELAEAPKRQV